MLTDGWSFLRSLVPGGDFALPEDACAANSRNETDPARQEAMRTRQAWKVESKYYTADFVKLYSAVWSQALKAYLQWNDNVAAGAANHASYGGVNQLVKSVVKLGSMLMYEAAPFKEAAKTALATKATVVDAPEFKAWALRVTDQLVICNLWAAYSKCRQPALDRAMDALSVVVFGAIKFIYAVVVAIVEAVVAAVDIVVRAGKGAFAFLTWIKWGSVALGGGFLIYKGKQIYDRRRAALPAGADAEGAE